jgi:folate-dependent phosphoribosylglycinamide formyltransferase PurN
MAVRLARSGHTPVGALALATLNRATVLRKIGQIGVANVARYAREKLIPQSTKALPKIHNSYLLPLLKHDKHDEGVFRSMREVAAAYDFPLALCHDQNAADAIARLEEWAPDLIVFTGGNILRKQLLQVPRLGVLNVHLGSLPEVRGMSTPEWSLLKQVPPGITIHYMDEGIDTGPILQKNELPGADTCASLSDLRNRLIAFGVEKIGEVVGALDRGKISATPQSGLDEDRQLFVMHEWLQRQAAGRLFTKRIASQTETVHG